MEPDLQQHNADQDQLNPLNYHENTDISAKEQNKRTIFKMNNYGWAKHVGIKTSGHKYVLGYSPVELYSSVIQPLTVKHSRYIYGKPNMFLQGKQPILNLRPSKFINELGWKPAAAIKPVIEVSLLPSRHHLVTKTQGVVHKDHIGVSPIHEVSHISNVQVPHDGYVHNVPVHMDYKHPHAVKPIPVAPNSLIHPVSVHTPSVPITLFQPETSSIPVPQLIPSPLFDVIKPNLGVLPLGAALPTSVLKGIPNDQGITFHSKPTVQHHSTLIPQSGLLPQEQLYTQPNLPSQSVASSAAPLPRSVLISRPTATLHPAFSGSIVGYHGSTSFINKMPSSQVSVEAAHLVLPPHLHFQFPKMLERLPPHPVLVQPHEHHDVQEPVTSDHAHFTQQPVAQMQYHQQLPLDTSSNFQLGNQEDSKNVFHQQLPDNAQHEQFENYQHYHPFFQQTISEPTNQLTDQVSTHQFYRGYINPQQNNFEELENPGGYVYQRPDLPLRSPIVQPGNTDLQLPLHLPHHYSFTQNAEQFQQKKEFSQLQNVFRPSIQLEPPYKK